MTGFLALVAEIIGRGDQSLTKMVLPYSVDNDPCHNVSRTILNVSQPVCHGLATVRCSGISGRGLPVRGLFPIAKEEWQEA